MSTISSRVLLFIRHATSSEPEHREAAADEVTDWASGSSPAICALLTGVLTMAAAQESDDAALEAQLNALLQLAEFLDPEITVHLEDIDKAAHPAVLGEYVRDLLGH
ncbi:hypothetical protein ABT236_32490 [Streptomyces sp. NPDC001523]|uniref:hypothetical protein n=1 Tax=Streptomyces sp. NPDC001523 TaxID=3154383 RepID=UPI00331D51B3